jgi:hypothetical protein
LGCSAAAAASPRIYYVRKRKGAVLLGWLYIGNWDSRTQLEDLGEFIKSTLNFVFFGKIEKDFSSNNFLTP